MINQARLKEALSYDEFTGKFTWNFSGINQYIIKGREAGNVSDGYRRIKIDGNFYKAHRLAWLYVYGEMPKDQIDHIDHNGLNNAIHNLRVVDYSDNLANKSKYANNHSGVNGVTFHKVTGKWQAHIQREKKRQYLGVHADFFEAICARKSAENLLGFHENHGKAL